MGEPREKYLVLGCSEYILKKPAIFEHELLYYDANKMSAA
jgi:hypothetical protein